ncbi:hypothetical protein [Scardovia wiggsiae]|uniref:hypothetical protein n=2 Tax=Scardovia wiggsiae TaxID=230143 RepID=UPI003BA9DC47
MMDDILGSMKEQAEKLAGIDLGNVNAGELADKAREAVKNADVGGLARKAKDILPDQADSVIDNITEKLK